MIPAHCLWLVATGNYLGVQRTYGALIAVPAYPYALACTGPLNSTGPFIVGAVPAGQDPRTIDVSSLLAAGLLVDGGTATFEAGATIVGDAKTVGTFMPEPTVLKGSRQEHISPENLPLIDVHAYDPGTGAAVEQFDSGALPSLVLEGLGRRAGSLNIAGNLTLDGAVLYVDGDLTVGGSVSGAGGVFATGKITISGASSLNTTNFCAVVAGGDLSLSGSSDTASYFQGLVMSEGGKMSVHKVTVMGAAIGAGTSGTALDVVDARFFFDQRAISLNVDETMPGNGVFQGPGSLSGGVSLQLQIPGTTAPPTVASWVAYLKSANRTTTPDSDFRASDFVVAGTGAPASESQLSGIVETSNFEAAKSQVYAALNKTGPILDQGNFSLDLNQFYKSNQRLRIVYSKSL